MPDPSISFTVDRQMEASASEIFVAWTEGFDTWFADPGAIRMHPVEGEPYWFEVVHEGRRHPHYGRFLVLEPARRIEQTWVTGAGGTEGAETVVTVELTASSRGTDLSLTHRGFADDASAGRHAESWPVILTHLDAVLSGRRT